MLFSAIIAALYIMVALGQRLNKEGLNETDGLEFELISCTHSVVVASLLL